MKKFIALLLCVLLTVSFAATAYANDAENADDVIVLRFSNVSSVTTTFNISSTGKATVKNRYVGISGVTTGGKITTKVQKKIGVIWVTVSGGSWTDNSTAIEYTKSHSVQLSSTGTYRAHVVFRISGSGGADDVITKNVQKTYN